MARDPSAEVLSQGQLLDLEADRLKELWQCQSQPVEWSELVQQSNGVDLETFLHASSSFAVRGAHGPDGFHPRHFAMTECDEVRRAMLLMMQAFESSGRWPRQVEFIISYLTVKPFPKQGWRVINLFCSCYRLWVRSKRGQMRQWESLNYRWYHAFSGQGGCIQAVHHQALRAELQVENSGNYANLMWDLKEYYERIPRDLLVARLIALDFPATVWAPALRMYSKTRLHTLGSDLRLVGHSVRGLPAGCGLVTPFC